MSISHSCLSVRRSTPLISYRATLSAEPLGLRALM